MSDILIRNEIRDIISRVRWLESKDGTMCHQTRYDALRNALGLLNRASNRERFAKTFSVLFSLMNEERKNLRLV